MNRRERRQFINKRTKCQFCNLRIESVDDLEMWDNVKMHKACAQRYWAMIRAAVRVANAEKEHG